jgi:hypothetical protein
MKALAEAGHEVTVVSHFPNKDPIENYKDESLKGKNDGLKNFVNLDVSEPDKFLKMNIFCLKFDIISISHSGLPIPSLTIIC